MNIKEIINEKISQKELLQAEKMSEYFTYGFEAEFIFEVKEQDILKEKKTEIEDFSSLDDFEIFFDTYFSILNQYQSKFDDYIEDLANNYTDKIATKEALDYLKENNPKNPDKTYDKIYNETFNEIFNKKLKELKNSVDIFYKWIRKQFGSVEKFINSFASSLDYEIIGDTIYYQYFDELTDRELYKLAKEKLSDYVNLDINVYIDSSEAEYSLKKDSSINFKEENQVFFRHLDELALSL